ncbi:MAG: hypothetical protein NVS2B12_28990 [Ktedonobacteraceae bacterium]
MQYRLRTTAKIRGPGTGTLQPVCFSLIKKHNYATYGMQFLQSEIRVKQFLDVFIVIVYKEIVKEFGPENCNSHIFARICARRVARSNSVVVECRGRKNVEYKARPYLKNMV